MELAEGYKYREKIYQNVNEIFKENPAFSRSPGSNELLKPKRNRQIAVQRQNNGMKATIAKRWVSRILKGSVVW